MIAMGAVAAIVVAFLAGRALWTATLGADDPQALLSTVSVPRLQELAAIVDAHGRPWREKA